MIGHTVQSKRTAIIVFDELNKNEDAGWMDREGGWIKEELGKERALCKVLQELIKMGEWIF